MISTFFRRLLAAIAVLIFSIVSLFAGNVEYETVSIDDVEFEVSVDWLKESAILYTDVNEFVVVDGIIYVNDMTFNKYNLHRVDAESGAEIGDISVKFNNISPTATSATFIGQDSYGHPYLASRSATSLEKSYPFEIYPLDFIGGVPTVSRKYTLKLINEMWPRDPVVYGDVTSGDFTVYAHAWPTQDIPVSGKDYGYVAKWEVVDGQCGFPVACVPAKISDLTIVPVDAERFILYDRGFYDRDYSYEPAVPTLMSFGEDGVSFAESTSVFDGKMDNRNANGIDIIELAGNAIMVYGSGFSATFAAAYLPNYPDTLTDSKDLWYFGQGVLAAPNETSLNPPCKGQVVHAVKVSDTEYQVYTMTRNVHFARITIRCRGGENTLHFESDNYETELAASSTMDIKLVGAFDDVAVTSSNPNVLTPMPGSMTEYIVIGSGTATLTATDTAGRSATTVVTILPEKGAFHLSNDIMISPESDYEAGIVYLPEVTSATDDVRYFIDGVEVPGGTVRLDPGEYLFETYAPLSATYLPAYSAVRIVVGERTYPEYLTAHYTSDGRSLMWNAPEHTQTVAKNNDGTYEFTLNVVGYDTMDDGSNAGHLFFSNWKSDAVPSRFSRAASDEGSLSDYVIYMPTEHRTEFGSGQAMRRVAVGNSGQPNYFRVKSGASYNLAVEMSGDSPTVELRTSPQTDVSDVTSDYAESTDYFTVDGIKTAVPTTGFYLKRQGTHISKVYIK